MPTDSECIETMKLRDSVSDTDKKHTKKIKWWLTAIDAYSQIKKATGMRWPYWKGWGLWDIDLGEIWDFIFIKCRFFCPKTSFEYHNNIKLWEDCIKKLQTDTLTKCLSLIWFNSDVFLWRFDDVKYVADEDKLMDGFSSTKKDADNKIQK